MGPRPRDVQQPTRATVGGGRSEPLQAMLAEYTALREESIQSIQHRILVMNFTFGALSVIIAGLVSRRVPDLMSGLIALLFVPQMAKAGLLIWLGEYNRSQRAGRWLTRLEAKINDLLESPDAMGWEGTLASRGTHMAYPYVATTVIVLGTGYAGSILGAYFLLVQFRAAFPHTPSWPVAVAIALYILTVEGLFLRFFRKKWREVRTDSEQIPTSARDAPGQR